MRLPEIQSEHFRRDENGSLPAAILLGHYIACLHNAADFLAAGNLAMVRWVLNEQAPSRAAEIVAGTFSESAKDYRSERDDDLRDDCMMHGG